MEETSIKDAVEVRNLVKVYDGKTRGLDGIDLEVKTGIAFVLIDHHHILCLWRLRSHINPSSIFMKTRERFMGIGQAIIMPLFFASNALYPVQIMPDVLKYLSMVNPMSYMVDAVRGLLITGDLSNLLIDTAAIATFDIGLFMLASISFKRIIE